jgi:CubicO group peptidase (beta-lactamase class C family)
VGSIQISFIGGIDFEFTLTRLLQVGIDWAGIFVERITGQSLEEYFREHIFTPCGITTITFYPTDEIKARMQQMVGRDVDHVGKLVHKPSIRPLDGEVGQLSGGGGLFGTSRDYLRFLQGVLASTKGDGKGLLSQQSYDLLFANALPPRGPNNTCYADLARMAKGQTYHDPSQVEAEELEHSIGLCLNPKDSVHGRKGGSGCWDGAAKTQYWLDPKTGIAVSLSPILPHLITGHG